MTQASTKKETLIHKALASSGTTHITGSPMWPQRLIAIFSLVFVLHALIPGAAYAAKNPDAQTATKALLDGDAFPEEEDDENSDLNLKFLPPASSAGIPSLRPPYPHYSDTPDYGFITEILTPPPLN